MPSACLSFWFYSLAIRVAFIYIFLYYKISSSQPPLREFEIKSSSSCCLCFCRYLQSDLKSHRTLYAIEQQPKKDKINLELKVVVYYLEEVVVGGGIGKKWWDKSEASEEISANGMSIISSICACLPINSPPFDVSSLEGSSLKMGSGNEMNVDKEI